MSGALDLLGTVLSVLGLLAVLCQLLRWAIQRRLPRATLRVLEETLAETDSLLTRCVEEGRLSHASDGAEFRRNLDSLQTRASELRLQTLSGRTYADEVRNLFKGLSRQMEDLCVNVRSTQADISSSASSAPRSSLSSEDRASVVSTELGTVTGSVRDEESTGLAYPSPFEPSSPPPSSPEFCSDLEPTTPHPSDLPPSAWEMPPKEVHDDSDFVHFDMATQPLLTGERRQSVSSSKTICTPASLRRKKRGGVISRARALARSARLSYA